VYCSIELDILVAAVIVMACLPVLFYFTFRYAEVKVIKAASPVLLRMVLIGALLLYGPVRKIKHFNFPVFQGNCEEFNCSGNFPFCIIF
jgi:hypothetical protein